MTRRGRRPWREESQNWRDQARIYWTLVIRGPMTLPDLRVWTNWTTHRANDAIFQLKRRGDVILVERDRHPHPGKGRRCGRWAPVLPE